MISCEISIVKRRPFVRRIYTTEDRSRSETPLLRSY